LGDIAARQGLLADAKQYFKQLAERRKSRGDHKGAAELSVRIGTLDPTDLESRLVAARAGLRHGRRGHGAARVPRRGRAPGRARREDPNAWTCSSKWPASTRPTSPDRSALAQAFVGRGDLARAREYLSPAFVGRQRAGIVAGPGRVTLVRRQARDEGRAACRQGDPLQPSNRESAVALGCRLAESAPEAGYQVIDVAADAAVEAGDYAAAAAALHEFVTRVRFHLVALMRLVEVCVDGQLEATMFEAQAQLADAYLEVGRGLEARIISEDLVAREPWNRANIERFRKSLVMLGESDPDAIIADRLSGDSPFMAADFIDLNEGVDLTAPVPRRRRRRARGVPIDRGGDAQARRARWPRRERRRRGDRHGGRRGGSTPRSASPPRRAGEREEDPRHAEEVAAEQYRLALTYQDMGMVEDAIAALEQAARSPRQRFDAASMLGRLHWSAGQLDKAVEWFERAAEAPAPTPDAGRALLYDLAATLEEVPANRVRALAVFVELETESGGYRDVGRPHRLSCREQARG
jgi:tetratricopeptide (TPR) repeat protein